MGRGRTARAVTVLGVADWDLYVHQRTLLERDASANSKDVWNGRPISKVVLAEPSLR